MNFLNIHSLKILIAGGSGLIGSRLTEMLLAKGHEVSWLSRSSKIRTVPTIFWDPLNGIFPIDKIRTFDIFINLAGAGIADKRWTNKRKTLIQHSRTVPNELLAKNLQNGPGSLKHYLSASAIGIYGDQGDRLCSEDNISEESNFLESSTRKWEHAIGLVNKMGLPTFIARIGLVTSTKGGFLPEVLKPMKWGFAVYFGKGNQYYSWVHLDDIANIFIYAIEKKLEGTYNAVAPNPLTNKELIKSVKSTIYPNSLVVPAPSFMLKLFLGELSTSVLNSTKVDASRIQEEGFSFKYPHFSDALNSFI